METNHPPIELVWYSPITGVKTCKIWLPNGELTGWCIAGFTTSLLNMLAQEVPLNISSSVEQHSQHSIQLLSTWITPFYHSSSQVPNLKFTHVHLQWRLHFGWEEQKQFLSLSTLQWAGQSVKKKHLPTLFLRSLSGFSPEEFIDQLGTLFMQDFAAIEGGLTMIIMREVPFMGVKLSVFSVNLTFPGCNCLHLNNILVYMVYIWVYTG